ncbi:tripartite tricarboxylate transporter TctB family protein [Nocardioides sp.]|uniref:tripartite tricarboxylate transporter TctB family protein n=1 Tax=Nocardioides sp. TaxID=35761 RepID=UPI001A321AC9|nr:tripartite tricarboxylate transporter TctB family protein [Nocardioides sp.]MBJ7357569.1 tripartite tricarboxylate transporter TctB family protein [Nocardioides sp.]
MSRTTPEPAARHVDRGQFALAAVLLVVGVYTIIDARGLTVGFADPVGPRVFPYLIGTGMVVLAVLLALATARGDLPQAEEGEDVDLTTPADWVTVGKLVGVLVLNLLLVSTLGWAITGALLFAGAAWALGSRTLVRDLLVGAVLSVASWYGLYGLGVPLEPGVLDGIL